MIQDLTPELFDPGVIGGMAQLATQAGLNRESLYRMLSGKGNPALSSLDKLLQALGLSLAIKVDTRKVA